MSTPITAILSRALTHWFLEQINRLVISHKRSTHPVIQSLEEAGVWSVMLRGSTLFLHPFPDVPYPKNNADIDCNILANEDFNQNMAQSALEQLFQGVLNARGWSLIEDPRPVVHFKDHPTHPILIEKKYLLHKSRWFMVIALSHTEIQSFVHENRLNIDGIAPIDLNTQEQSWLNDYLRQHAGASISIELPINCIFRFHTTDLPVYTSEGRQFPRPAAHHFIGWTYYHPFSQLIEKLACINVPYRNKAVDIIDAYNLLHILEQETLFDMLELSTMMFQPDSRFVRESIINALHAVDVDLAMYIMQYHRLPESFASQMNSPSTPKQLATQWAELQDNAQTGYLRTLPSREQWNQICTLIAKFSSVFFEQPQSHTERQQ